MKVIHVLRKPLSEPTVVANVLRHGTGAVNVDATRIQMTPEDREVITSMGGFGSEGWANTTSPAYNTNNPKNPMVRTQAIAHSQGRWPANLVLQHLDGCKQTGVREDSIKRPAPEYNPSVHQGKRASLNGIGCSRGDAYYSTEVNAPVFECAEGCPVAALDAQGGVLKSPRPYAKTQAGFRTEYVGGAAKSPELQSTEYGDTGGASRFFKQFGSS